MCAENARKSQSRSRTSTGMCGTLCAPSTSMSAPTRCASFAELLDRVDRAEHVRHLRDGDDLRLLGRSSRARRPRSACRRRRSRCSAAWRRFRAAMSCHGTRLLWCSIAEKTISSPRLEELASPGVGDEVDRLRRVAGEDDLLLRVLGVDEAADLERATLRTPPSPLRPACAGRGGCWRCSARSSARAHRSPAAASASSPRCRDTPAACRAPCDRGSGSRSRIRSTS